MATAEFQDTQFSRSVDDAEFPYRAISRAAVTSIIMILPAVLGLVPAFSPMLFFAVVGMVAGTFAIRTISRYPDEYSGLTLAWFGLIVNAMLLVGGIAEHAYIYATEVPEGYDRVQFYELQQAEPLPDIPNATAVALDGKAIFLKGYIHPSSGSGMLRRFILVPDLGTCCFGGQPRSTDMIEVILTGGKTVRAGMTKLKLAGKFYLNPQSQKAADFDNQIFYQMRVEQLR